MKVGNENFKMVNLEETLFKGNKEQVRSITCTNSEEDGRYFFLLHPFLYIYFDKMILIYVSFSFSYGNYFSHEQSLFCNSVDSSNFWYIIGQ